MPTFQVELEDGKAYEVEADREPTHEEIMSALGYGQPTLPPPEGKLASAARSFASGVLPAVGTALGAVIGTAAGAESGPGAIATGAAGAGLGGWAATKLQHWLMGDKWFKENEAQLAANAAANPISAGAGEIVPTLVSMTGGGAPVTKLAGIGERAIAAAGVQAGTREAEIIANAAIRKATEGMGVKAIGLRSGEAAVTGLRLGASQTAQQLAQGQDVSLEDFADNMAKSAFQFGPLGIVPHAQSLARALGYSIPQSGITALSGAIYDSLKGKPFDFEEITKKAGADVIPFALFNAVAHGIQHTRNKIAKGQEIAVGAPAPGEEPPEGGMLTPIPEPPEGGGPPAEELAPLDLSQQPAATPEAVLATARAHPDALSPAEEGRMFELLKRRDAGLDFPPGMAKELDSLVGRNNRAVNAAVNAETDPKAAAAEAAAQHAAQADAPAVAAVMGDIADGKRVETFTKPETTTPDENIIQPPTDILPKAPEGTGGARPAGEGTPEGGAGSKAAAARPEGEATGLIEAEQPANLPKVKDLKPNHVVIGIVGYPHYEHQGVEQIPYDGTREGAQKLAVDLRRQAADQGASFAGTLTLATDTDGNFKWVISPNGKIEDVNTPEGQYSLGDLDAFTKDRAKRAKIASEAGDTKTADSIIVDQIGAELKLSDRPISNALHDEIIEAAALEKAGGEVPDDRVRGFRDYIKQRKTHSEVNLDYAKKAVAKALKLLPSITDEALREQQRARIESVMDRVSAEHASVQEAIKAKPREIQPVDTSVKAGDPVTVKLFKDDEEPSEGGKFIRAYDAGFKDGPRAEITYYGRGRTVRLRDLYLPDKKTSVTPKLTETHAPETRKETPEGEHARTEARPAVPEDRGEIRQAEGARPDGGRGAEGGAKEAEALSFEDFEKQYRETFKRWMGYKPEEIGSRHYAEILSKMAEEHPDWVEKIEAAPEPTKPEAPQQPASKPEGRKEKPQHGKEARQKGEVAKTRAKRNGPQVPLSAEAEAGGGKPPAIKPRRIYRTPPLPPLPEGDPPDIIDWLQNNRLDYPPNKAQKAEWKAKGSYPGEWDLLERNPIPFNYKRFIFVKGGNKLDNAAKAAFRDKVPGIKSDDPEAFLEAIHQSMAEREANKPKNRTAANDYDLWMKQMEETHIAQVKDFQEETKKGDGKQAIDTWDVNAGDTVWVDGEPFTAERDEQTGDVILEDGSRFGKQGLETGETIYVEKIDRAPIEGEEGIGLEPEEHPDYNPVTGKIETPSETTPESPMPPEGDTLPKEPGALIPEEEMPFNLVSETADERADREARELAAENEKKSREQEQAAAEMEKRQGKLFEDAPPTIDPFASLKSQGPMLKGVTVEKGHADVAIDKLPDEVKSLVKAAQDRGDLIVTDKANLERDVPGLTPEELAYVRDNDAEGFYKDGKMVVVADAIGVTQADGSGMRALARVINHELFHDVFREVVEKNPDLKAQWEDFIHRIPESDLHDLADRYTHLADWTVNPESKRRLIEEWGAEKWQQYQAGRMTEAEKNLFEKFLDVIRKVWSHVMSGFAKPKATDADLQAYFDSIAKARGREAGERGGELRASFSGERAMLPAKMHDSLQTAKDMAANGKDAKTIRALTGWFPGKYDGKMRWEIPDYGMKWKHDVNATETKEFEDGRYWTSNNDPSRAKRGFAADAKLGEIVDHPELFAAYPKAKEIPVRIAVSPPHPNNPEEGAFYPVTGEIMVKASSAKRARSSLIHEIQHWIQNEEGFASGASPDRTIGGEFDEPWSRHKILSAESDLAFARGDVKRGTELRDEANRILEDLNAKVSDEGKSLGDIFGKQLGMEGYQRTAGEIEARDVQSRRDYAPEQLRAVEPYSSENIAREDALIMERGGGLKASLKPRDEEYRRALQGDRGDDPLPEKSDSASDAAWLARNPESAKELQRMVELPQVKQNLTNNGVELRTNGIGHMVMPDGTGVSPVSRAANIAKGYAIQNHWEVALDAGYLPQELREYGNLNLLPSRIVNGLLKKGWMRWTGGNSFEVWKFTPTQFRVLQDRLEREIPYGRQAHVYISELGTGKHWHFQLTDFIENNSSLKETLANLRPEHQDIPDDPLSLNLPDSDIIRRDDSGRIIPLEERFKSDKPDIRFSLKGERRTREEQDAMIRRGELTPAANELVNIRREQFGWDTFEPPDSREDKDVMDRVLRKWSNNPDYPKSVVDRLEKGGAAPTDEDVAAMIVRARDLENRVARVERVLNDKNAPQDEKISANLSNQQLLDELDRTQRVLNTAGTEQGRAFKMRQNLLAADYSMTGMVKKAVAAKGGEDLTPDERGRLETISKALRELQLRNDELQKKLDAAPSQAAMDALKAKLDEHLASGKKYDKAADEKAQDSEIKKAGWFERALNFLTGRERDVADAIGEKLRKMDILQQRIEAMKAAQKAKDIKPSLKDLPDEFGKGMTLEQMEAELNRLHVSVKADLEELDGINRAKTTKPKEKTKVSDFTKKDLLDAAERERLRSTLRDLKNEPVPPPEEQFAEIRKILKQHARKPMSEADFKKALAERGVTDEQAAKMYAHSQRSDQEVPHKVLEGMMRKFISEGDEDAHSIAGKISDWLKDRGVNWSPGQVMRGIAKYGEVITPSQNYVKKKGREIRAEMLVLSQIETVRNELRNPDLTGYRRDEATQKLRDLVKVRNDLMRKYAIPSRSAASQFKGARDRAIRTLENRLADLMKELHGEGVPRPEKPKTDLGERGRALQKEVQEISDYLKDLKGTPDLTADVWNERREKQADAIIERMTKAMKEGRFVREEPQKFEESAALKEKQKAIETLREAFNQMRDADPQYQLRQRELKDRNLTRAMQRALDYWKGRIERKEFTTPTKEERVLSKEQQDIQLQIEQEKRKFDKLKRGWEQANRTNLQKIQDWIVKLKRMWVLSSPVSVGKLTAAALSRFGNMGIEDVMGNPLSRLLPEEFAKKGVIEGATSRDAIAKAISGAIEKIGKDIADLYRTGQTEMDIKFAKKGGYDDDWTGFFGRIHAILKSPVKRLAFQLAMEKQTRVGLSTGEDVTDPAVQARYGVRAYEWANRQIFMQDNPFSKIWNAALGTAERNDWKSFATFGRVLFPIVKVPTNIVAEAFTYVGGLPMAAANIAKMMKSGVVEVGGMKEAMKDVAKVWEAGLKNLTPDQADLIQRQIKKGSLGLGLLAMGYFNPQAAGGYYMQGQKRREDEAQFGAFRVGDFNVPKWLTHTPFFEVIQFGATVRRLSDSQFTKHGDEQGLTAGVAGAALGLLEETPFVNEMMHFSHLGEKDGVSKFIGELAKSSVVPSAIDFIARRTDVRNPEGISPVEHPLDYLNLPTQRREAKGVIENIESGVPGLRGTLPAKITGPFAPDQPVPDKIKDYAATGAPMPSAPHKGTLEAKNGPIDDEKWQKYVELRGKIIRDEMLKSMWELKRANEEEQHRIIGRISNKATTTAKERMRLK